MQETVRGCRWRAGQLGQMERFLNSGLGIYGLLQKGVKGVKRGEKG